MCQIYTYTQKDWIAMAECRLQASYAKVLYEASFMC